MINGAKGLVQWELIASQHHSVGRSELRHRRGLAPPADADGDALRGDEDEDADADE